MKFFNWVQNKLNGGQASKKANAVPPASTSSEAKAEEETGKEKFRDWSNGWLTIGTLGNRDQREDEEIQRRAQINCGTTTSEKGEIQGSCSPDPDELAEFTAEEVGQLQKELTRLLKRKPPPPPLPGESQDHDHHRDLPLDRFLNCPSSLEVDRTISNRYSVYSSDQYDEEDTIDRTIRAIIGRCNQVSMKKKKSIGKKSLSFLLNKMFVCATASVPTTPTPSFRDTLPESRMEKLLRTMLSKKIYPQSGSRAPSTKRYLVDIPQIKAQKEDDEETQTKQADGSCKWVKTDSEYIVLDLWIDGSPNQKDLPI